MRPSQFFHHCPRCGAKQPNPPAGNVFTCAACGFTLYFSSANATAVFITRDDGMVLFILRAKEPAKGKLSPPGGFIELVERVEQGLCREVREEVGLELADIRFLCSQLNSYHYLDVTYPTLDFFFTARAVEAGSARALDEVESFCWLRPEDISSDDIAFASTRAALAFWVERRRVQ